MEHISDTAVLAATAFQALQPARPDYATAPILEGFNWAECTAQIEPGEWYMVVFRSVRRDEGEHLTLEMYDYGAYIEAQRRASGLLTYFRGYPNQRRECLSFCIWTNRQEAARAARLPLHTIAISKVDEMYESFSLERYYLRKRSLDAPLEAEPAPAHPHGVDPAWERSAS